MNIRIAGPVLDHLRIAWNVITAEGGILVRGSAKLLGGLLGAVIR